MANLTTEMAAQIPEAVAYALLWKIIDIEKKGTITDINGAAKCDRKWLLDAYAECLLAVRNPEDRTR